MKTETSQVLAKEFTPYGNGITRRKADGNTMYLEVVLLHGEYFEAEFRRVCAIEKIKSQGRIKYYVCQF